MTELQQSQDNTVNNLQTSDDEKQKIPVDSAENPSEKQTIKSQIINLIRLASPIFIANLCSEAFGFISVIFAGQIGNADMIAGVGLAGTTCWIMCYSVLFACIKPIETFTS